MLNHFPFEFIIFEFVGLASRSYPGAALSKNIPAALVIRHIYPSQ
ncbi:hypothetical protein [Paenibacillus tuaregi]|nr:hypothetical protein [Paenibacillus tuaregi]